jgi:hypothetical protein
LQSSAKTSPSSLSLRYLNITLAFYINRNPRITLIPKESII